MSFINYLSREINCKIVYYGPGLCGKTTNLQYIYNKTNPDAKGKMISLATETERTLFFDFLPLALGEIRGFKTRFHLYTVPGQVFYDASRKLILKGVDGVVFVADSQIARMEANVESLENLRTNLAEQGYSLDKLPYVVQYNKRDMPGIAPVEELRAFDEWASRNPRTDRRPWEAAVLTFYRGQEREVRHHLRRWSNQGDAMRHFTRGPKQRPHLSVELCTVDRFQGHEADLVIITFASAHPTSFLESPNRLNVALTRARYQRVIVGDRAAMQRARGSVLGVLAENEPWDRIVTGGAQ